MMSTWSRWNYHPTLMPGHFILYRCDVYIYPLGSAHPAFQYEIQVLGPKAASHADIQGVGERAMEKIRRRLGDDFWTRHRMGVRVHDNMSNYT